MPLTERGRADAAVAAKVIDGLPFNVAFTSRLKRAGDTLSIVLKTIKQTKIPIECDSALNERHYGDLQGLNKAETAEKYGQDQVKLWRRSYATRPPNGESMDDCERRTLPFFLQYVLPLVQAGKNILVAAHGNSLRPMMKYLDQLTPDQAAGLEIGLCTPYVYTYEGKRLIKREVLEVQGIVTQGASTTEAKVTEGRV